MTEKKIPTTQQMTEYRQLRKTMTTAEEYEKVMAFEEEYDIFTQVFTEEGRKGVKDAAGEVLVPAEFDEVGCTFADFCRGFAIPVVKDGKMALVSPDGKGTLLTEPVYDPSVSMTVSLSLSRTGRRVLPQEVERSSFQRRWMRCILHSTLLQHTQRTASSGSL